MNGFYNYIVKVTSQIHCVDEKNPLDKVVIEDIVSIV